MEKKLFSIILSACDDDTEIEILMDDSEVELLRKISTESIRIAGKSSCKPILEIQELIPWVKE